MKRFPFLFMYFLSGQLNAQPLPPSKESFANAIFLAVVDSGFSKYYLCARAIPCRFTVFDYGELVKYSLRESVSLGILNELAGKAYRDSAEGIWEEDQLTKAKCLDDDQIRGILDPTWSVRYNPRLNNREKKTAIRNIQKQRLHQPQEEKLVFYFSKPVFTGDLQYAAIDLDQRCDRHECGVLATYLFRWDGYRWKTIGVVPAGAG
jgi:hypothetical protein